MKIFKDVFQKYFYMLVAVQITLKKKYNYNEMKLKKEKLALINKNNFCAKIKPSHYFSNSVRDLKY